MILYNIHLLSSAIYKITIVTELCLIVMQVQIGAIILALMCCLLIGVSSAGRCGVSAPQISLSELISRCNSDSRSRTGACVAAMHRFCIRVEYPTAMATLGVSREVADGRIGISCVKSLLWQNVPITTLQAHHFSCTKAKNQHRDCLAAIHHYCQDTLGGTQYAGMSQEVPGDLTALTIRCFEASYKERIPVDTLTALHSGCVLPDSDSADCFAAASRWCVYAGYSGGITQEVNLNGILVACYNAEFTHDVFVTRTNDFYLAENRVDQVCSLNFEVDQGALLSETPRYLKTETYDNTASSVTLFSEFQISKEVTDTSSFTHSHNLTIGAEVSVSAQLPFFDGTDISLSTEFTSGISLTSETMTTSSYSDTSSVEVPPGEVIVKEAIVQRAALTVPWTATVINGLGAAKTIGGQWNGVNTFNFRFMQEDIDGFCQ